jgi:hypothetical protein
LPLLKRKPDLQDQYSTKPDAIADDAEDFLQLDDLDYSDDGDADEDFSKALDTLDRFAPEGGWSKIVTDDLPEPLSKKVTRRRRRSNDRDTQAIKTIQESELSADPTHYPSLVGTLHPTISTPTTPQKSPTPCNENVKAPAWVFTTDRAKLFAANRAIAGAAHAFTLNLGPDQLQRAVASPKGFSAYMRLAIMRTLERELGYVPLFWFVVDVNSQGRLHLHGGIACDDNALVATARALRHAGGNWGAVKHHDRQLLLEPQTHLDGWVNYALGNIAKVRRLIPGKGVVISNPLRKLAQALYENNYRKPK